MRIRFHRFLLALMMLALPLQTFASAAMLGCAFSQQAAVEQGAKPDTMMMDCHEQEQPDSPAAQHNCKHCAACALASALPVPVASAPAIPPVPDSFAAQPAASFNGFIPDGPERPPKASLA
ncbi:MAG: hypothetical protein R6W97_04935 [Thiobacillus sp.]